MLPRARTAAAALRRPRRGLHLLVNVELLLLVIGNLRPIDNLQFTPLVGAAPAPAVRELARAGELDLVPIRAFGLRHDALGALDHTLRPDEGIEAAAVRY